ncbi:phospholipase C at 21C isoform X2 [Arctopsyche grandis]|uniref:phospholipase C at 21C isoform X2 n=1 Tax=Arctopsyche grandis TaxID=121162 RepID=UPI00406D8D00
MEDEDAKSCAPAVTAVAAVPAVPAVTAVTSSSSSYSSAATRLRPPNVSPHFVAGEKFIKWDEDSGAGTPVTLRIDPKGFFLYWIDQNHEVDLLDIATVRDARTGSFAKIPKDPKLRQIVTMGSQDTLEEKTVTICFGVDFVNLTFVNFCCTKKEIAQQWTDVIFNLAYNLSLINSPSIMFLQKVHTKLSLDVDKAGKIPIKNIVRLFAQNKEDRKKVEKALDASGLPSGKNDNISPSKFQFEDFFTFYKNLTQRTEVEKVFEDLVGIKRRLMSISQLVEFLNRTQRDPRLNEILHPYANTARAKDLIHQYEPNKFNAQKGQLSFDGFLRYLMSEDNPIIANTKLELCDDMEQPLAHYFINSSHNTYLTGHQLTGKSSVEIYRQCLLAGCRCVELDFWNGRTEEPVIVHGYTFVQDISAKDVLEAIAESAFKTSDFPVILSFENHCNPRQQAKIANYCRDIFGDMLLDKALESHALEPGGSLPPPSLLRRKIIIKNKKKHHHHHHNKKALTPGIPEDSCTVVALQGNGDIGATHHAHQLTRQGSKDSTASSETDSSSEDEGVNTSSVAIVGATDGSEVAIVGIGSVAAPGDKAQQARETEAGAEISALVNYVQPVHFNTFEISKKKNRFYEMSSFDEKQATTLLKERPIEFVNYNKHQLSRVYPAGTRFDSSNFMPQVFWNAGCQLVALNYQTLDLAMQLNLGIFEYNLRSGYILKPEFMRRKDRRLDPFAESTVDGIIAGTVSVTVISGQFLTDKRVGTYVEVDMYGLPADTVRKRFRTKIVQNNGMNPVYGEDPFVFKKVVLPELASIRLAAYEESGKLIGHRVLPVVGLCPGYRHVTLRNELSQPLLMTSLFLLVVVKDYVPDGLSDLAEALANPIKYQSEREKREQQLSVLTDDMETEGSEDQLGSVPASVKKDAASALKQGKGANWSPRHRASVAGITHQGSLQQPTPVPLAAASSSPNIAAEPVSTSLISPSTAPVPSASVDGDNDQTTTQEVQAKTISTLDQSLNVAACGEALPSEELEAESFERVMNSKTVKEKRAELEKKVETLKRKHEKERARALHGHQRSCDLSSSDSAARRTKFYMTNKLVKRLSSKNILIFCIRDNSNSDTLGATTIEGEGGSGSSGESGALWREQASQMQELRERYHETIYAQADKYLKQSQQSQLKLLKVLLERETDEVMRRLQAARRGEVKALAKVHKDRDELVRIKREVASQVVERGVAERLRLSQLYEKRRDALTRQHEKVRQQLVTNKEKDKAALVQEYESPLNALDGDKSMSDGNVPL